MSALLNTIGAIAFAVFLFSAQALATGPTEHEAAQDMELAKRDAIEAARTAFRVKKATERDAWKACKAAYGNYAQVVTLRTGEFVCRRLEGVL